MLVIVPQRGPCQLPGMTSAGVPLILLPGALGPLEGGDIAGWLSAGRPAITIDYRADDRLQRLLARVLAAAEGEGADRFDLLGQSYGGWIAQCVARAHPDRVRRLVLSHSFALEPRQAWRFRLGRRMIELMPHRLGARLLLKRAGRALTPVAMKDPALHERLLDTLERRLRDPEFWKGLAAQQSCLADSLAADFAALAPVAPDVPVLIIESGEDPMVPERARARLRALYPGAQVVRFERAGHVSAIAEPQSYAWAVEAFLAQPRAAPRG
jgi:pimeloyl-ACP methyl ester carboxylesterase